MAPPGSGAQRSLSLTEELERLEQSITLTMQEIDSNFAKAHRIVATSILPIVERYAKNSEAVWEGSKFWREFFEAAANVSLNGYEQAEVDDSAVNTEADNTHGDDDNTITDQDVYLSPSQALHDDDDFTMTSPERTFRENVDADDPILSSPSLDRSTPRVPKPKGGKKTTSRDATAPKFTNVGSPYETLRREMRGEDGGPSEPQPTTPGKRAPALPDMSMTPGSSPFALPPDSALKNANKDTILHQGILNRTYRVAATPLTAKRAQRAAMAGTPGSRWVRAMDSQLSSPDVPEPQLTAAIFSSPVKPGRSVLTPARKKAVVEHREARRRSAKGIVSGEDESDEQEVEEATRARSAFTARSTAGWESDDDEMPDFSPPKTMRFEFGENRIIQTPAREASRRIVEDLLYSAGGDISDEPEEYSPSIVRRDHNFQDETF